MKRLVRTSAVESDSSLDHPVDKFANNFEFFLIPEE